MKRPTLGLLRQKRELAVVNPANGLRFTVSLREWQGVLWAIRVRRRDGRRESWNPFTTAHRLISQGVPELWLESLRFDKAGICRGLPSRCSG